MSRKKKPFVAAAPPNPQLEIELSNPNVMSLRGHLLQIQEYQETGRANDAYNHLDWLIRNMHAV